MLFCAVKRTLRHLSVVGLFSAVVIAHPNTVNAGISIHGGTPESRAQILAEVDARWRSEITRNTELAITIGASALAEFCSANKQTPVLATYLYRSRYLEIQEDCAQPVAAILADTALHYQARLAEVLFPGSRTATLTRNPGLGASDQTTMVDVLLSAPEEGVAKGLGRLITEGRWDAFLLPIDHSIYADADYRLALETLFRHRRVAIVSIESLLSQGAVAATYYSNTQLEAALLESVEHFLSTGKLIGKQPNLINVGINRAALRNLLGRIITAEELRALEAEVNGG